MRELCRSICPFSNRGIALRRLLSTNTHGESEVESCSYAFNFQPSKYCCCCFFFLIVVPSFHWKINPSESFSERHNLGNLLFLCVYINFLLLFGINKALPYFFLYCNCCFSLFVWQIFWLHLVTFFFFAL